MKTLGSKAAEYLKAVIKPQVSAKRELWTWVKNKKDAGLEARRPFEQKWLLNMAFLAGRQYIYFNSSVHEVQNLSPVRGRIRMMDNQLMPRVRRQIADFIKNNPTMSVVPSTTEDEDIEAAKAGDKFLKSFWQSNRMKKKTRLGAGWIYSTGNVFMDHRWNRKLGPIKINEKTGTVEYLGDVDVGIWSPFEIIVPAMVMGDVDIHTFPWMIKCKWKSLEYFPDNYSENGSKVEEEQLSTNLINTSFLLGQSQGTQTRKFPGALLMEYYHKPDAKFPKGKFISCANGIILDEADYPFDKYNIEQFKDMDMPGQFWGKATVEDGITLQKTWNQTLSDIMEFNRTIGRGKYLVPENSRMRIEFDNTTGQHIYYKPVMGHKPELLTMKNMPTSFQQVLSTTYQSLNNLFSQHEVTQGTNKSDIRSGEMLSILREQDAHGMIPAHAVFEESMEGLMEGVLKRVQKGYDTTRMITVTGRDKEVSVMAFSASILRGNTNVTIKKQSSLPDSRIAREARIMERFEKALYGDPLNPEVRRHVMTMLEDAIVEDLYSTEKKDETVARWENQMLQMGVDVPINNYDNHMIHAVEHSNFQKSLDYQKVKLQDPKKFIELETKFLNHQMQHQNFIMEQRKAMMAEEQAMKGGGK